MTRVLLTGATGFVGRALYPALAAASDVRCTTRDAQRARARYPNRAWVEADVTQPQALAAALEGVEVAYYLVHSMGSRGGGGDFSRREEESARGFAHAAAKAGVRRIVYLGGVAPEGAASKHLQSRRRTGEALREAGVPVVELRAAMIVGLGSASWQIVRDLSMRLPVMVLPAWMLHRSEPVAIQDVVAALVHAGLGKDVPSGIYGLPGPDALTGEQVLQRVAALRGLKARALRVPFLSPRLSSLWIGWVTRADLQLARELVEGLTCDLLAEGPAFWEQMPGGHAPLRFDQAARAALEAEAASLPFKAAAAEWLIQHLAPWKHAG